MQVETDPDVAWVADLSGRDPRSAEEALAGARAEHRLFAHLDREHRAGGRVSYVEIDAPLELYALVRLLRPHHVVEVGVSSGVSSAYLLGALERNGHGTLHSIDLPAADRRPEERARSSSASWTLPPGRGSGWAVPFRLRRRWDLRLGDKRDVLPVLTEELPCIDLLLYDVPHGCSAVRSEFRRLDPLVPLGSVAIVDHGPGGGLCPALAGWAQHWQTAPVRRAGLGLYGARRAPRRHTEAGRRGQAPGPAR